MLLHFTKVGIFNKLVFMIRSPFFKLNKKPRKKIAPILMVFLLIGIIVMQFFDTHLKNEITPNGIVSFELAKYLETTKAILNSWSSEAKIFAGLSLGFDFLFLLIYSFFIAIAIHNLNERLWKNTVFYTFSVRLIYLQFVAALFDVLENISLIKLLTGNLQQFWVTVAYYSSALKFGLLCLGIIYIIINFSYAMLKKSKG